MKLHVYHDPGHAWVAVKKTLLGKLGIADNISAYSYERGDWALLEEDADASRLMSAMQEAGLEAQLVHHHTDRRSKVGGYKGYVGPQAAERARKAWEEVRARADGEACLTE